MSLTGSASPAARALRRLRGTCAPGPTPTTASAAPRWRATALLAVAIGGLASFGCPPRPAAPPSPPNVLIIVVDTLRYDATSLASRSGATPFLESLAAKGLEFATAYSTFDNTMPSHFSLLTGYVREEHPTLGQAEFALPFQLGRLGYETLGVSANGNLDPRFMPLFSGFGRFINLHGRWLGMTDEERAALSAPLDERLDYWGASKNKPNRRAVYCSADRVSRNLVRFIKEAAPRRRPFFAFANFMEPHDPYLPDPAVVKSDECRRDLPIGFEAAIRYRTLPDFFIHPQTIRDPVRRRDVARRLAAAARPWCLADDLTPAHLAVYRCRYDATVRDIDRGLARLFATLTEMRLLDSTIIVVTSDHGESFGEAGFVTHQLGGMGDLEATQRVPLLFLLPPRFGARPARIAEPVTIADVAPTLYDLLGIDWRPLFTAGGIGNCGRSLLRELGVARVPPTRALDLPRGRVQADTRGGEPSAEAMERLRELGYVQ